MKSYQQFFAELKRRHVFKVAGIYGIVSFGVLQAADLMLPRLGLPDWTVTFMVAIVVLAFPVVLIIAWAFEVTPDGVKRTDAPSPGEIEAIVSAPLSQRWPAGLLALVGVLALVASTWWIARRTGPTAVDHTSTARTGAEIRLAGADPAADDRASIAVLPFADMSPAGDQRYFSDGITEEILNVLTRIRDLRVAARTSAFAYRDRQLDMRQIGDSLGVRYLIEGSVRKDGDQLRITAQLIDAADGSHLWANSYDRQLASVFQIQSEIAEAIAEELKIPLGLDVDRLVRPTEDLEAYDLYLAGRARMRERGASLAEAVRLFEAAIARDSSWVPAWAGLAEAQELMGWYPEAWDEVPEDAEGKNAITGAHWARAEPIARRALALDPDNASANVALGSILRNRRQWAEAEEAYLRALSADPDNPEAHQQYAEMLADQGRIREAVLAAERAVALDRVPIRMFWEVVTLLADDRAEEVIETIPTDRAALEPLVGFFRDVLVIAHLQAGRAEGYMDPAGDSALTREIRQALRPDSPGTLPTELWAGAGWAEAALLVAREQPDTAAVVLAAGMELKTNPPGLIWLPIFDGLRGHPAYLEMLKGFNLEGRTPQRTPRDEVDAP